MPRASENVCKGITEAQTYICIVHTNALRNDWMLCSNSCERQSIAEPRPLGEKDNVRIVYIWRSNCPNAFSEYAVRLILSRISKPLFSLPRAQTNASSSKRSDTLKSISSVKPTQSQIYLSNFIQSTSAHHHYLSTSSTPPHPVNLIQSASSRQPHLVNRT